MRQCDDEFVLVKQKGARVDVQQGARLLALSLLFVTEDKQICRCSSTNEDAI